MKTKYKDNHKWLLTPLLGAMTYLLSLGLFIAPQTAEASHFKGGQITYEWVPGTDNYIITVRSYWRLPNPFLSRYESVNVSGVGNVNLTAKGTTNLPDGITFEALDSGMVTLPGSGSFDITTNTVCCRWNGAGTSPSVSNQNFGSSTDTRLAARIVHTQGAGNSSPEFFDVPIFTFLNNNIVTLNFNFSDPENDPQTFTLSTPYDMASGNTQVVNNYSAAPATLTATGQTFTWEKPNAPGVYAFAVQVEDANTGAYVRRDFSLVVTSAQTNNPPSLSACQTITIETGQTATYNVEGFDTDANDIVTLVANGVPMNRGATFNQTSGNPATSTFDWTPGPADTGTFIMQFVATDDGQPQLSVAQNCTIVVSPPASTPPPSFEQDTCHAANVVSFTPGPDKFGDPVDPDRQDPNEALGEPEGDDTYNFVSLGIDGELVLDFGACPVTNDPKVAKGDITVVETSFGDPTCAQYPEKADVYGRFDPSDPWTFMGQICLTGTVNTAASGLMNGVTQIRIVDATGNNTPARDGYDVDGIIAECECGTPPIPPCVCESPDSVVSYMQGTRRDGSPVLANRSDPWEATGIPEDDDTYNFFTLGYGGNIVMKWSGNTGVRNMLGMDDLSIVETSFKDPACRRYPETAAIELSLDGVNWVAYDTICLDGTVNLDNYGFGPNDCVKYIRITDVTRLFGGGATDGYDVDGVACVGAGPQKRTTSNKEPLVADDFIKVYPNPATSTANIRVEAMEDNSITVRVFNMMGQLVNTYSAYGLIDETMDVSNFSSGLYLIEIDIDGVIMNEKLMVQPSK